MIREFHVENFLSIRDRQELSFIAKESESPFVAKVADGTFIYKLGVFFGANASGKSNLLQALNTVFRLLAFPQPDVDSGTIGYLPFVLTNNSPTRMFVSFYANDVRYDYDVEYDKKHILKEELNYYPNRSKSLFYSRKFVNDGVQADIKFGGSLRLQPKTQDSIRENTLNNHSVLSVCHKNIFKEDINPLLKLHSYIVRYYHDIDGDRRNERIIETLREAYKDERKHKFFRTMLEKADLNIEDFRPVTEDREISPSLKELVQKEQFPDEVKDNLLRPTVETVVFQNHSDERSFDVKFEFQSAGTVKYIRILNALYDMITENHVYYLDELGEDIHYDLLFHYLGVFLYNSKNSQLLITSQVYTLLMEDLVNENRGAVWFVEKDTGSASSEYNRADDFGLHKNLSLFNAYFAGRLGAKPQLGSVFIDLE